MQHAAVDAAPPRSFAEVTDSQFPSRKKVKIGWSSCEFSFFVKSAIVQNMQPVS